MRRPGNLNGDFKQASTWAAGGRLGWLSNPGTLLYLTGGRTQAKFDQLDFFTFAGTTPVRYIPSQTLHGWFIGAGVESQLANNISLRLEYRYSDFGSRNIDRLFSATNAFSTQVGEDLFTQSIRVALTYKFGWHRHDEPPLK